ncbi:MAG: ABC transporter substrate-binding protein [Tuberibacillus sp.]
MVKRLIIGLISLVVVLAMATGCGSDKASGDSSSGKSKSGKTKISLRLNWIMSGEHAPFYVALDKGFYEKEGLDVKIDEGDGSATTLKLTANNSYDLGYADAGTTSKGIAKGLPVKMIACYQQENPMAVIFKPEQNIKTPQDLIGKSVALTPGDSLTQIFPALLKANNIPEDKVNILSIAQPAAKETAMLEDKVDSFTAYYTDHIPRMEEQNNQKFDYLRYSDFGIHILTSGLLASEKTLKEKPDAVKKFIAATNKGWKYTVDHPGEAADILAKHSKKESKEVALQEIKIMIPNVHTKNSEGKPYGWMSDKDWKTSIELLQKYAEMGGSSKTTDYYTNQYIPK